jgi:hypothetical protein
MNLNHVIPEPRRQPSGMPEFSSLQTVCQGHYSSLQGYFVPAKPGNDFEAETMPRVRCLSDGTHMDLAEV